MLHIINQIEEKARAEDITIITTEFTFSSFDNFLQNMREIAKRADNERFRRLILINLIKSARVIYCEIAENSN